MMLYVDDVDDAVDVFEFFFSLWRRELLNFAMTHI